MKANRIGLAAAAAALLTAAVPLAADQDGEVVARLEDARTTPPDRADQLKAEAEALFSQPKEWKRAVRLLVMSADLRSADDPEAYDCLLFAGRIGVAVGDLRGARVSLERAAAHALARGAIVDAATAYIDAAHTAVEMKDAHGAQELVDKAALLVKSPLLSAEQRSMLKARLNA
jgi:hypothetical protein